MDDSLVNKSRKKTDFSLTKTDTGDNGILWHCNKGERKSGFILCLLLLLHLMGAHLRWPGNGRQVLTHGFSLCCWRPSSPGPKWTDGSSHLDWKSGIELFPGCLPPPAQNNCGQVLNDCSYDWSLSISEWYFLKSFFFHLCFIWNKLHQNCTNVITVCDLTDEYIKQNCLTDIWGFCHW